MKNKKNELARIKTMIDNDRFRTGDCFLELLTKDVESVFTDYFDFSEKLDVVISKGRSGFVVEVRLNVDRLKAFGTLPK